MMVTPPAASAPPADLDPQNDEMMTVLINDEQSAVQAATRQKYIYKFDNEPLCKWCAIYTCAMIMLGGGLIVLVYFLWR